VSENRHEGVETINRDITICLNLIERIQEEYYMLEIYDYHTADWRKNFTPVKDDPEFSELHVDTVSENLDTYFTLHKAAVKKCLKKDRTLSSSKEKLARAVAHYKQNQCSRLLFSILSERIFWWWD